MPWVKKGSNQWNLMINGESAGYVVKTTYNDGHVEYSGIAMNRKTRKVSKAVAGKTLTPVKNAVMRMAKNLHK